jgi:DNA-binding IclR family transcriptional regulator
MDQPFAHTLSFDDLEVLVLVENGGATPREVADSLGMDLEESKALFYDLLRRGLLACQEESTTFVLTPLARSLRNDEAFSAAAFAAALTEAGTKDQG